jgi:hypothetical protein
MHKPAKIWPLKLSNKVVNRQEPRKRRTTLIINMFCFSKHRFTLKTMKKRRKKKVRKRRRNNYLFDKKKGKKFFLFIEHEVLFYETPFLHQKVLSKPSARQTALLSAEGKKQCKQSN